MCKTTPCNKILKSIYNIHNYLTIIPVLNNIVKISYRANHVLPG